MFPTSKDIEFFREAKRVQELWEPKAGDWYVSLTMDLRSGPTAGTIEHQSEPIVLPSQFSIFNNFLKNRQRLWPRIEYIWLPRQGQLQEMLEERGYFWLLSFLKADNESWCSFGNQEKQHFGSKKGPTPSIALGKCLLEVLDG